MRSPVLSKPMLGPLFGAVVGLALLAGCSTDPVNPDGCRDIETARCESAASCSALFPNLDVEQCKLFYHDQCLHGLASEADPGQPRIDQCVDAIRKAGACASSGQTPCQLSISSAEVPCDVIQHPELYKECDFLIPPVAVAAEAGTDATTEIATAAETSD